MVTTTNPANVCDDLIDDDEDMDTEAELESGSSDVLITFTVASGMWKRGDIDIMTELFPYEHFDHDTLRERWEARWKEWEELAADSSIRDDFATVDQVFQSLKKKGVLALHAHEFRGEDSLFAQAYELGQQLGRGIHAYCYYHWRDAVPAGIRTTLSLKFGAFHWNSEIGTMVGGLLAREFTAAGMTVVDSANPRFDSLVDQNCPNTNQLILDRLSWMRRPLPKQ